MIYRGRTSFKNIMIERTPHTSSSALFVAHPGHELRLHGWMSREKPICMILTTGSRSGSDTTRLQASAEVIEAAGGRSSELFGAVLDRDLYNFILAGDAAPFRRWKATLADILVSGRVTRLVIDGWQLYSVSHDLAHVMGRLAASEASRRLGHEIELLQYDVVPALLGGPIDVSSPACCVTLSDRELTAKLAAVDSYPGIELELIELKQIEKEAHARMEGLFAPPPLDAIMRPPDAPPKYEAYGEARQAKGIYKDVIRWHHVEDIIKQMMVA
jgi:hypothetical protein